MRFRHAADESLALALCHGDGQTSRILNAVDMAWNVLLRSLAGPRLVGRVRTIRRDLRRRRVVA